MVLRELLGGEPLFVLFGRDALTLSAFALLPVSGLKAVGETPELFLGWELLRTIGGWTVGVCHRILLFDLLVGIIYQEK